MPGLPQLMARRLLALLWVALVALIIVSAVALTAARVVFSNAGAYRHQVTSWLSERLHQPVEVASLDAEMQGLQPTLLLRGVHLLDQQGNQTLLQFRELQVGIDLWNSAWRRKMVLGELTVVGADLSVSRDRRGIIRVEGLELSRTSEPVPATDTTAVGDWIFSQSNLVIRDSTLYWQDQLRGKAMQRFDIASIELRNQGDRHQLEGVATLPAGLGETVRIAADFTASSQALHEGKGRFYINGLGIRLAPLLEQLQQPQIESGTGQIDLELWGEWSGTRITRLEGESGVRDLILKQENGKAPFELDLVNGIFLWERNKKGWELDIPRLRIVRNGEAWPDTHLRLSATGSGWRSVCYELQTSFAEIGDVSDLLLFSNLLPPKMRKAVRAVRPRGRLTDLQLVYRPGSIPAQRFSLSGRLHGVRLEPWRKLPGVEGVDAILWADAESGAIHLESGRGKVNFPHLARNAWFFERLQGELSWQREAGVWYLSGRNLTLRNRDIEAAAQLELTLAGANVPPFLDLQVVFKNGNVARASRYYPVAIMHKKLVAWLDRSLISGRVTGGSLVLHGRLKKGVFPYRKGEGMFEVGFSVRDVVLDYHRGWPRIDALAAEAVFHGAGMSIDARSGKIMKARIDGTHVRIADYHDHLLTVLGEARGDAGDMLRFLRKSPLAPSADPALARMSAAGEATLGLYLGIPLGRHRDGKQVEYRGIVTLQESSFGYRLGSGHLEATNIDGRVQFDREGYHSESLSAFIFDRPARVAVTTRREEDDTSVTRIAIDGRVLPAPLARQLKLPLLEHLEGESEFRAVLDLSYHHTHPGMALGIELDSSLEGISSRLPAPLQKARNEARVLHIEWDGSRDRVSFGYAGEFSGVLSLNGHGVLQRGHILFGPGDVRLPGSSLLRITGVLEDFAAGEWLQLLPGGLLHAGGGEGLSGLRVELDLDKLHLLPATIAVEGGGGGGRLAIDPRFWPALSVNIRELGYQRLKLGSLRFEARSAKQGLLIEPLQLTAPYMQLQGKVRWQVKGEQRVEADLALTAANTGTMLKALGFAAMVRGDNLVAKSDLRWPGSPFDFNLQALQGNVHLDIGSGHIESMEPGAGRLFGLFSLQALPRRLMLDFRDLFGKGFRFDRIKGDIRLEAGNAKTHDLLLEGPTARIAVSGRTGYVARDYDQHILVIPGDGSNLFVAGALAWGPQAGALIWMAEKLLRLDKVAQYVYHVTGSWDNPVIVRGREKGKATPPAPQ